MKFLLTVLSSASLLQGAFAQGWCGRCAQVAGDPHVLTFKGDHIQCQGVGDYILAKSSVTDFEVQARFFIPEVGIVNDEHGREASATSRTVINTGRPGEPTIEVIMTPEGDEPLPNGARTTSVHDCKAEYYVDGVQKEFHSHQVYEAADKYYFQRGWQQFRDSRGRSFHKPVRVFTFLNGDHLQYKVTLEWDYKFGCYMNVLLCVPCSMYGQDINGLLGNPVGTVSDFAERDGTELPKPPTATEETEYCADNWCQEKSWESLFKDPSKYHRCTSDIVTDWDTVVEEADDSIKRQCEGEVNCIIDAIVTEDVDVGLRTLEEAKENGFTPDPEWTKEDDEEESDSYTCAKAGVGGETAFARPADGSGCFLDDGLERWGWRITIPESSGSYQYDVYAGAGQCKLAPEGGGVAVGTLTVSYDAMTQQCEGTYEATGGHTLQEFQFYCGADPYPKTANGANTVAPGKYSCGHLETTDHLSDTCVVNNVQPVNGFVSIIAHAVSCDKPEGSTTPQGRSFNTNQKIGSGSGDPHFKTWTGDKYDYHGECDLVLLDHPTFANGTGLKLHIRTTRVKYFSFIERAALQIGNHTLEFDNDVQNFLIDGEVAEPDRPRQRTMLGDYWVRRDPKSVSVRIRDQGKGDKNRVKIDFHTRKNGFPAVVVDGGHTDLFKGSLGLLGDWATGKKLARDGVTEIEVDPSDAEAFALEWQVRDDEPMLFSEARHPQYPATCIPPAKHLMNRLGAQSMRAEAEEACAHWKEDVEDCIFDVIATRDVLVAQEGHIVHAS